MNRGLVLLGVALFVGGAFADGPEQAVASLAARLLGDRAAEFTFAVIAPVDGKDVFEIEGVDGKVVVRGNNGVAMATGLNWYLKYNCNASVSWCGDQLVLPKPLPVPEKMRKETPYKYRYYFNYCTFSYSMAFWDWDRWQREIDWMALNGINMPLSVTGQEAIWQTVYRGLGLSDADLQKFFVGPAYLPFGWMGCIDEWGGPLPKSWIDAHLDLEKKIVARERELGMTPVLQGFTGHVPQAIKEKFPEANLRQLPSWCGFPGTFFLDPADPLFVKIGKAFVEEQTRQFGTDHLYASDTFIEMSPPSNDLSFLANMGKAVYDAMASADPAAIWVMQGWIFVNNPKFWQPPQAKAMLGAVPDDHMLLLDLFCDAQPSWKLTESFYGKPWVWCIVHNFGATPGLFGKLSTLANDPPAALASPDRGKLMGLGMMMEGIEQNPPVYELTMEMAWRAEPPNLDEWIKSYSDRRYGKANAAAEKAWGELLRSVYSSAASPRSVISARPDLDAPVWKAGDAPYDPLKLLEAWSTLQECSTDIGALETYQYDLVNVARQVLSNLAGPLHAKMIAAYKDKDVARFKVAARAFADLMDDFDSLLATRGEFRLGRWIARARKWGTTEEEKSHYEWNARNQVTLWGPRLSDLHEYARKDWAGLVQGFYLPRWQIFMGRLRESLIDNKPFDVEQFKNDITAWEEKWAHLQNPYSPEPEGDPVKTAETLLMKYSPVIKDVYNEVIDRK